MKHQIGEDNPTKQDRPVLDQPPPLLHIVSDAHLEPFRQPDLLKGREYLLCRRMIRHDPQRQQKCEESKDVEEQNDALGQRKMLRKVDIEPHGQQDEQEYCQRRLPGQGVVGRGVCELNHGLHNASKLQTTGRNTRDPAKTAKPADDV